MADYGFPGFDWHGPEFEADARRRVGLGLKAGLIMGTGAVKRTLSIPAPRKRLRNRKTGAFYYVATVPAIKGAPPRKLSDRLRAGQTWEINATGTTGRIGTNVIYARRLEKTDHEFLMKTINLIRAEMGYVVGYTAIRGN